MREVPLVTQVLLALLVPRESVVSQDSLEREDRQEKLVNPVKQDCKGLRVQEDHQESEVREDPLDLQGQPVLMVNLVAKVREERGDHLDWQVKEGLLDCQDLQDLMADKVNEGHLGRLDHLEREGQQVKWVCQVTKVYQDLLVREDSLDHRERGDHLEHLVSPDHRACKAKEVKQDSKERGDNQDCLVKEVSLEDQVKMAEQAQVAQLVREEIEDHQDQLEQLELLDQQDREVHQVHKDSLVKEEVLGRQGHQEQQDRMDSQEKEGKGDQVGLQEQLDHLVKLVCLDHLAELVLLVPEVPQDNQASQDKGGNLDLLVLLVLLDSPGHRDPVVLEEKVVTGVQLVYLDVQVNRVKGEKEVPMGKLVSLDKVDLLVKQDFQGTEAYQELRVSQEREALPVRGEILVLLEHLVALAGLVNRALRERGVCLESQEKLEEMAAQVHLDQEVLQDLQENVDHQVPQAPQDLLDPADSVDLLDRGASLEHRDLVASQDLLEELVNLAVKVNQG